MAFSLKTRGGVVVRRNKAFETAFCVVWLGCLATGELAAGERPVTADSNIVLSVISPPGSGLQLQIDYPATFTNRLDVYVSTNLQSRAWGLHATNLATLGSNAVLWSDPTADRTGQRFYQVGNADLDSDQDGLADARERLIHHTNPLMPDSDLDGVPDGAELRRGTDPVSGGPSSITLYVDSDTGSDGLDGLRPEMGDGHGPKRSLSAASGTSYARDVIQFCGTSVFLEPSLCIGSTDVTLRPMGGVCVQP